MAWGRKTPSGYQSKVKAAKRPRERENLHVVAEGAVFTFPALAIGPELAGNDSNLGLFEKVSISGSHKARKSVQYLQVWRHWL